MVLAVLGTSVAYRAGCGLKLEAHRSFRTQRQRRNISLVPCAAATVASPTPGRWLGTAKDVTIPTEPEEELPRYGVELTAEEWNPLGLPLAPTSFAASTGGGSGARAGGRDNSSSSGGGDFFSGDLPKKLGLLLVLLVFSRVGVYIRLPGVDVDRFAEAMSGSGLLGYIDTLSGGSISKVGLFSLGIVPYINASILLQLLATAFPSLKKLQREEGPQGRARFTLYQKLAALAFAVAQASGQLTYIRPYVADWSIEWLIGGVITLTAGAVILVHVADTITELKLGNGTSVLIFANIASALPSSVGAAFSQAATSNQANIAVYGLAFFLTTLGIVYVQDAERQIPIAYASRYRAGALQRQAYLPFKVNATGVMPVIFSSSLLALPSAAARYANSPIVEKAAAALAPGGPFYLPTNVALIVAFNYLYTFLQLDPKELSDQLKRQGASIPGVRPGRNTAEYITKTLDRMSVLGSGFLGALAAAPALVEGLTGLQAFRGFAGTSVLILVGVATDTARKFRAEIAMQKYGDVDKLYDDLKAITCTGVPTIREIELINCKVPRHPPRGPFGPLSLSPVLSVDSFPMDPEPTAMDTQHQQQQQHMYPSCEGRSNNSSSSDVFRMDLSDDPNKTHHLLKHCLSDGQRNEALEHFATEDVKEAARDISKMGQRELQNKFKLVYGAATHSNNNDWLRRKLYEAIGAAPIKAATKAKVRKPAPKIRKTSSLDPPFQASPAYASSLERRSRRTPRGTPKGLALAETLKRHRLGTSSLPSSPVVGRSVLDMHRYLAHDVGTSTSEDDGSWQGGEDTDDVDDEEEGVQARPVMMNLPRMMLQNHHQQQQQQQVVAGRAYSAYMIPPPQTRPQSAFALGASLPSRMQAPAPLAPINISRRASSSGLALALGADFFQGSSDVWGSDAWADAALKASAARQAPPSGLAPAIEDDDIMLLPMDLSAFEQAGALL